MAITHTEDLPRAPLWHKTGATTTTPVVVAIPPGASVIKIWSDVAALIAFGTSPTAPSVASTNGVYTIATSGIPTGGTFILKTLGSNTVAIARNASAATIDSALETILGTGAITSAGGSLPTAVTVTFDTAPYVGTNPPRLGVASQALTGGTNPNVTVVATTPGGNPYSYLEAATQEFYSLAPNTYFLYVAAVSASGNYRASAFK